MSIANTIKGAEIMVKNEKELNAKAKIFADFLAEKEIKAFKQEIVGDEMNAVVFRSSMEVKGNVLPLIVVLDDSIYGILRMQLVPQAMNEDNKLDVLKFVNEQNMKYKVFKYYVADNGDLCLDSCILLTPEQENGPLIYTVIDVVLKHLQDNYAEMMKSVWAAKK